MARFTQYPSASIADYADATTFLIANSDGEIKQASLEGLRDTFGSSIQSTSVTIPSAEVLALNSTPKEIVPAQGTGKGIEVISALLKVDFNSVAYATNTGLILRCATATDQQANSDIASTLSQNVKFRITQSAGVGLTQIVANQSLEAYVDTGNPTAGDSDITVYVLYRVVTL